MNYQTWSKKKFWAVMVGVFFLGAFIVSSGSEPQVASTADTKPEVVTKTQVKEVKVESRENFDRLAAIDQEIFGLSGEVINAQTTALQAAGALLSQYPFITNQDIEATTVIINQQTERVREATTKLDPLQVKRAELMTK